MLDNNALTYIRAAVHIEALRQEAEAYHAGRVTPPKESYRSGLAKWLNAVAERLDSTVKPQHLGSQR